MKISCIIPCFNYGHFLEEAVDSVLSQTYQACEIIILDDASTDQTEEIARHLQKKNSLVRYIRNEQNIGLVENFNKGVTLSQGDYICILGADDTLEPDYFQECANLCKEQDDIAIVYSDFRLFGEYAQKVYLEQFPKLKKYKDSDYIIYFPDFRTEDFNKLFNNGTNVINTSALYKKEIFHKIGPYRNLLEKGIPEDYDFFSRAITSGYQACHIAKPLLNYRHHSLKQNNLEVKKVAEQIFYKERHAELLKDVQQMNKKIDSLEQENKKLLEEIENARAFIQNKEQDIIGLKEIIQQKTPNSLVDNLLKKILKTTT